MLNGRWVSSREESLLRGDDEQLKLSDRSKCEEDDRLAVLARAATESQKVSAALAEL